MSNTVLITGAQGQLGHKLVSQANAFGLTPVALGRGDLDITHLETVRAAQRRYSPSVVINAAAYTAVDRAEEEPELADQVNRLGPVNLARVFGPVGPLIHVSTDYVFDGTATTPYREDMPTAPLGVYGRTKRDGERAILDCAFGSVLRTAWVYSDQGHNFLKTMIRAGLARRALNVVNDQHGSPTRADDIARAALTMARRQLDEGSQTAGLYHFTAGGETSWHGFAVEIFRALKQQTGIEVAVSPIATCDYPTPAQRPAYSVLDTRKITDTFGLDIAGWQDPVAATVASVLAREEQTA